MERRDPKFDHIIATVPHVYKEVEIVNQVLVTGALGEPATVAVSYDETPGIQALCGTALNRAASARRHASRLRDYEYKRLGTVSLLAGLDLHAGRVTEIVNDAHKSSGCIEFLTKLNGMRSTRPETLLRWNSPRTTRVFHFSSASAGIVHFSFIKRTPD